MKNDEFIDKFVEESGSEYDSDPGMEQTSYGEPLLVLPCNSYQKVIEFIAKNREFVYRYMLDLIDAGIENNWPTIEYFRVGNTDFVVLLEKKNIENSLLNLREFFVNTELYEYASKCNKLLDRHRVNLLLDSMNT